MFSEPCHAGGIKQTAATLRDSIPSDIQKGSAVRFRQSLSFYHVIALYLRERQGELKFGFAAVRTDGNLAAVEIDDVLYDVQTEARAGFIHRARTVQIGRAHV